MHQEFTRQLDPIIQILEENEMKYFSHKGEYSGGGSRSLQKKLYDEIEEKIIGVNTLF
jgi:hypothetical protein